jgi:hypothetical protein
MGSDILALNAEHRTRKNPHVSEKIPNDPACQIGESEEGNSMVV